jgi:hypothetical protein
VHTRTIARYLRTARQDPEPQSSQVWPAGKSSQAHRNRLVPTSLPRQDRKGQRRQTPRNVSRFLAHSLCVSPFCDTGTNDNLHKLADGFVTFLLLPMELFSLCHHTLRVAHVVVHVIACSIFSFGLLLIFVSPLPLFCLLFRLYFRFHVVLFLFLLLPAEIPAISTGSLRQPLQRSG